MKHFCKRMLTLLMILALTASPVLAEARVGEDTSTEMGGWTTLETNDDASLPDVLGRAKWRKKVKLMNWYKGGSSVLRRGGYGYLYDIKTGIRLRIKRCGGVSHADVEPATRKDTAKLKKLSGGHYSWSRRPAILYANGKYVACSIVTKPHGRQTIRNNGYNGQFCLHMLNSKTHGSNRVDEEHMECVRKAYNWAH